MTASPYDMSGRRALVTGASAGIGRAIALGLAAQGADIVVHHLGDPQGAESLVREIGALGRTATAVEADFAAPSAVAGLVAAAASGASIDILIANAAIEHRRPWQAVSAADIAAHVSVNFAATLELVQRLVPPMAERGWGRVVALGSVLARRPRAETLVYASLKAAQLTAIRAIARDLAGQGVTLNVVSPGAIETERVAGRYADPGFRAAVVAKIPAGRPGRPEDCVAPVLMLCSPAAGYITGADIPVDGGWSIGDPPAPPLDTAS